MDQSLTWLLIKSGNYSLMASVYSLEWVSHANYSKDFNCVLSSLHTLNSHWQGDEHRPPPLSLISKCYKDCSGRGRFLVLCSDVSDSSPIVASGEGYFCSVNMEKHVENVILQRGAFCGKSLLIRWYVGVIWVSINYRSCQYLKPLKTLV